METFMTIVAGILLTFGTYLVLSKSLLRIILGFPFFTHGVHLMLLTMAGLKQGAAPLVGEQPVVYGSVAASVDPDIDRHQFCPDSLFSRAGISDLR